MSTKLLKEYVRRILAEDVRISIERSTETSSPSLKVFDLADASGDDIGDEIETLIKRQTSTPQISYGTRTVWDAETQKKKRQRIIRDASRQEIIDKVIAPLGLDGREEELFSVISPWRRDGIEALERILIAQERTGRKFPFFAYGGAARVGNTIPFPDDPSPSTVDYIANMTPRVGRNDTGKGELLLALLTGGMTGGPLGDLEIGGKIWEVKATQGTARLGIVTSREFVRRLEEWWKVGQELPTAPEDFRDFLESLNRSDRTQRFYPQIREALDGIVRLAVGPIDGFAVVGNRSIKFLPVDDAAFDTYSKSQRVQIKFKSI